MRTFTVAGVLTGLALLWTSVAGASAAVPVRYVRVPGPTEWLAVDGGGAFVLRRSGQRPSVVRVDLATGRRAVVFRADGFPGDEAFAAAGTLTFDVQVPSSPGRSQAIVVPTAPGGVGRVVREVAEGPGPAPCSELAVDGITPVGEPVVSTFSWPCPNRHGGTETVTVLAAGGDRTLVTTPPGDFGDAPLGNLETPTLSAGPWLVRAQGPSRLRLVDTTTGAVRPFVSTLRGARLFPSDLQADGRLILTEILLRRLGGYVQRVRVVGPADGARGGRVLGTLGTPPRLNATLCGGRLVVLRTQGRRTRVEVDGHEIARVSTPADPRFGCDARRVVVAAAGAETRLAVVALPAAAPAAG